MKSFVIAGLTFIAISQCYAEAEPPSAFLGNVPESPKVQDFYNARCAQLANDNGLLSSDARHQEYLGNCIKDMAKIWPVGYDDSE